MLKVENAAVLVSVISMTAPLISSDTRSVGLFVFQLLFAMLLQYHITCLKKGSCVSYAWINLLLPALVSVGWVYFLIEKQKAEFASCGTHKKPEFYGKKVEFAHCGTPEFMEVKKTKKIIGHDGEEKTVYVS